MSAGPATTTSGTGGDGAPPRLPAPGGLRAEAGVGTVTLRWEPVDGAIGYLVHRGAADDGDLAPLDHHGGGLLAVPHGPYTDTTGVPGTAYRYAVASVSHVAAGDAVSDTVAVVPAVEVTGPCCEAVPATPLAPGSGPDPIVTVHVEANHVTRELPRPWRPMVGAEHLSLLLSEESVGGQRIADDVASALRAAHTELGVERVRAHAILCDDLGVYREVDGEPVHDFSRVDAVYDRVRELGLRPVVELSFMPRDLAADPTATLFHYGAIVSPPRDWDRWADLVRALVAHLVERYGLEEIREEWAFEVWNEPNFSLLWTGTQEDYWRLYDVTVRAVHAVDPTLVVGGPASAATGWLDELLTHTESSGTAVGFVSTHAYGNVPLDVRPLLARHGRADAPVWWTEWGVSPELYGPAHDGVFAAAFVARGMRSAAGRIDALSSWMLSDHIEELGRPPRLLHGGFGLRTVGELRKPRWWALHLLERLGTQEVASRLAGDGAEGMVQVWASRDEESDGDAGEVTIALWNGSLDQTALDGAAHLDRHVVVHLHGLVDGPYVVLERRVDVDHSNIGAHWDRLRGDSGADWPDEAQWAELRRLDRLDDGAEPRRLEAVHGQVTLELDLPNPGLVLLEVVPGHA